MKQRIAIATCVIGIGCIVGIAATGSQTIDDLEFSRFSVRHHENGKVARGKLTKPQKIDGFECQRWVHFHENAQISQMQLAKTAKVQKVAVVTGSTVFFTSEGKLRMVWFAKDAKLNGITARGGAKISTGFHPNGKIASCFLRDASVIDGVPCSSSVFKPVFFHDNGKLKSATLSKAATIQEVRFQKGDKAQFTKAGKLIRP